METKFMEKISKIDLFLEREGLPDIYLTLNRITFLLLGIVLGLLITKLL